MKPSYNPNKAVSAGNYRINILYTDTHKSHSIYYDESSPLKSLQTQAKEISYQPAVVDLINNRYTQLYNEAMYGLKNYNEKEIKQMSYIHKMSIIERYEQAQFLLNIWKQEIVHQKVGSFLTTVFHKSDFAKAMAHYPKSISPFDLCSITFKQLGIRKEQIAEKLVDLGLLPINYEILEYGMG